MIFFGLTFVMMPFNAQGGGSGAAAVSSTIRQSLLSNPVASLALPELVAQVLPALAFSREI